MEFFSDEKIFTINSVVKKQIEQVISFEQDISKLCNMSMTKHLAFVIMVEVVASNGVMLPAVWFLCNSVYYHFTDIKHFCNV